MDEYDNYDDVAVAEEQTAETQEQNAGYVTEDRSRKARMVNIASALLELAERYEDDPEKSKVEIGVLRRYILRRLDEQGLDHPELDETGDLKAHADAYGGGGLGLRRHQGRALLTERTLETCQRFLADPDSFEAADVISAEELGV